MSTDIIKRVKEKGPVGLRSTRIGGKLAFGVATVQSAISSQATSVLVRLDDQRERRLTVSNLCIANARYFGGGMKVAPQAILDDGLFDVISIGDLGALRILTNAHKLYSGTHLEMDEVHQARAQEVAVRPA